MTTLYLLSALQLEASVLKALWFVFVFAKYWGYNGQGFSNRRIKLCLHLM